MSDRLPKSELDQLRDEVQLLTAEVDILKTDPPPATTKTGWWRRLFGHLVYSGPEECGQCRYWNSSNPHWNNNLSNCSLLHGNYNTTSKDTCDQFAPRWRYKRRVRD